MIDEVRQFLNKYSIKNKPVIIAFSAGPDSCALARVINELKDEFSLNITLTYFNHMWRDEAKEEENFTIDFAKKFNFDYIISRAPEDIPHNEELARDLRYQFLYNAAKEKNTDTVFLAHNKNDNIETLVYRIIKGTSLKGMCAIPENRDIYYRPMLKIEKRDILKYLDELNQQYLVDCSNFDSKYKRNFIRNEILPLFEKINQNYMNSIENLITTSCYVSKITQKAVCDIMGKISNNDIINRSEYIQLGEEYRYEILNSYLGSRLKYRDFKTIKKLDDFIVANPHSKTSLNRTEFLRTRKNKIFIEEYKEAKDE